MSLTEPTRIDELLDPTTPIRRLTDIRLAARARATRLLMVGDGLIPIQHEIRIAELAADARKIREYPGYGSIHGDAHERLEAARDDRVLFYQERRAEKHHQYVTKKLRD